MRCIDRDGPARVRLTDVAKELGVTRQTVYRLFESTEALFDEVAIAAAVEFYERLGASLAEIDDPADVLVEALVHTVERLPSEPYLGEILALNPSSSSKQMTGPAASEFARAFLVGLDVEWSSAGFDDHDLDELVELFLRLLQSFSLDPDRHRSSAERRAFLERWIRPMVRSRMSAARSGAGSQPS